MLPEETRLTISDLKAWVSGFFDGSSGGNLLGFARRPGCVTQIFADEGSTDYPQRELVQQLVREDAKRAASHER
jgi:hypothetical protein